MSVKHRDLEFIIIYIYRKIQRCVICITMVTNAVLSYKVSKQQHKKKCKGSRRLPCGTPQKPHWSPQMINNPLFLTGECRFYDVSYWRPHSVSKMFYNQTVTYHCFHHSLRNHYTCTNITGGWIFVCNQYICGLTNGLLKQRESFSSNGSVIIVTGLTINYKRKHGHQCEQWDLRYAFAWWGESIGWKRGIFHTFNIIKGHFCVTMRCMKNYAMDLDLLNYLYLWQTEVQMKLHWFSSWVYFYSTSRGQ